MSRQKKKNQEEDEVQVTEEAPQAVDEAQIVEEEMPMGPHPVSLLQVRIKCVDACDSDELW